MNTSAIYDNGVYTVVVTTILEAESGNPLEVYGVFNIETGVREAELRSYAHAIGWADQLREAVDKLVLKANQDATLLEAMQGDGGADTDHTTAVDTTDIEPEKWSSHGDGYATPTPMLTKEEASNKIDGV